MLIASEIECALNARAQWEEKVQSIIKKRDDSLRYLNTYTEERRALYDTETSYLMVSSQFEREYSQAQQHLKRLKYLLFPPKQTKGQITEDNIAHAKQVPITDFIDESCAKKHAGKVVIQCPLNTHRDSSPSFTIYTDNNHFHCFGCNTNGDAITFIKLTQGLSFPQAVKHLCNLPA